MIRLLLFGVVGYFVLSLLLLGLVDLSLRHREDFEAAGRGSKWIWLTALVLTPTVAIAPFFASGRDALWLALVPAAWVVVEVAYFAVVWPKLESARRLRLPDQMIAPPPACICLPAPKEKTEKSVSGRSPETPSKH